MDIKSDAGDTVGTLTVGLPATGAAAVTADPTSDAVTFTDGVNGTNEAEAVLDLAGLELDKAGDVTFSLLGKEYTVTVEEPEIADPEAIAAKLVDAINADKPTDTDAGDFTAAVNGTTATQINLTSANKAAVDDFATFATGTYTVEGVAPEDVGGGAGTGKGLTLQIGDTSDTYNQLVVSVQDMHTTALGTDADKDGVVDTGASIEDISIENISDANAAINIIKDAINMVSSQRGDLGAIQNRLEHTMNNLSVMEENITNAESAIRDTDIADEMTAYTKNNILPQSAQAMLAQANQVPRASCLCSSNSSEQASFLVRKTA